MVFSPLEPDENGVSTPKSDAASVQPPLFGVDTPFFWMQARVVSQVRTLPETVVWHRHTSERLFDDDRC
jgi:hypothetical protein